MALELTRSPKAYAEEGSETGVPLVDLESIVGTLVERYRHSETISTASTGATAVRINYKPLQFATEYRIFLTNSAGTILLDATINALTWQGLVHAAVGDTLVHDGQPTQTGHRLTPADGVTPSDPNIVVGRTEDNFMLIQGIALPSDAILDVFSTEFSGGAIEERSWRQTAAAPHVVRLKILATTTPDAPPDLGYDGSFATGLAGTDWVELDAPFPNPSLSGATVYQLRADAVYNPLAGRWLISNIEIFSPEGGVSVQYATSDTGPWHDTQASDDTWRRWRDALLYWHVEPLNELDDGWRFLTSFSWDSSATPDPGIYTAWVKALAFPVQFDDWKYLLMTYTWSRDDLVVHLPIPCEILRSALTSAATFTSAVGRAAQFRRNGTASWDDPNVSSTARADAERMTVQYQFERQDSEESDRQASLIRIDSASSGKAATLRFYVGR